MFAPLPEGTLPRFPFGVKPKYLRATCPLYLLQTLYDHVGDAPYRVWQVLVGLRDENAVAHPTRAYVALTLGFSEATVARGLRTLASVGLVTYLGRRGMDVPERRRVVHRAVHCWHVEGEIRAGRDKETGRLKFCKLPREVVLLVNRLPLRTARTWGGVRPGAGRPRKPIIVEAAQTPAQEVEEAETRVVAGSKIKCGGDQNNPWLFSSPRRGEDPNTATDSSVGGGSLFASAPPASTGLDGVRSVGAKSGMGRGGGRSVLGMMQQRGDLSVPGGLWAYLERELGVPRRPTPTMVPMIVTPEPPRLDPKAPDEELARTLAAAYRTAVEHEFPGTRCFTLAKGDIKRSKWYPVLVQGARALLDHDIAPLSWASWSCGAWVDYQRENGDERPSPPPLQWVFGAKRLGEYRWQYRAGADGLGGRIVYPVALREMIRRYSMMRQAVLAVIAEDGYIDDARVARAVETTYDRSLHDTLLQRARHDAQAVQAQLNDGAKKGRWVW